MAWVHVSMLLLPQAGLISNRNQLVPFFMIHALQDMPGMPGLYMATLFSGALSTLSSGINSLAANTVQDVMAGCLQGVSEKTATVIAKALVFLYGTAIIVLAYYARYLQGPVTQISSTVFGACGSSVLGMFVIGCTVPWANKYGALTGGLVSITLNIWIALGSIFYGRKPTLLSPVPSDQCYNLLSNGSVTTTNGPHPLTTSTSPWVGNGYENDFALPVTVDLMSMLMSSNSSSPSPLSSSLSLLSLSSSSPPSSSSSSLSVVVASASLLPGFTTESSSHDPHAYTMFVYDISYVWIAVIGTTTSCLVGLAVSWMTRHWVKRPTPARFILPMVRRYWFGDDVTTTVAIDELSERMMKDNGDTDHETNEKNVVC